MTEGNRAGVLLLLAEIEELKSTNDSIVAAWGASDQSHKAVIARLTAERAALAAQLTDARNAVLREGMERDEARAQVAVLRDALVLASGFVPEAATECGWTVDLALTDTQAAAEAHDAAVRAKAIMEMADGIDAANEADGRPFSAATIRAALKKAGHTPTVTAADIIAAATAPEGS